MISNVLIGAVLGGSLTFIFTVMLMSAKRNDYLYLKGMPITYVNKSNEVKEAVVHQTAKATDQYIVLMAPNRSFPFIVDVTSLTNPQNEA